MWQTMIRPLFNAAMVLLEYEPSATQKENLMRVWRGTLKQFMIIKKRTPDMLVNEMINCDLEEAASQLVVECKAQWEQRKRCEKVKSKLRAKKKVNYLRCVSNDWCEIVNFQVSLCKGCNGRQN